MAKLRYRKISVAIWNDEKFRDSSPECKLVFLYVLTHPLMTSFGAMRGSEGSIRDELQIPAEGFSKGYREGLAKGFLKADPKACLIIVPKFLKHNPPDSPNVVRSWFALMDNLPCCDLLSQYLQQVKVYTEGYGEGYAKAFREGYGEGYALSPSSELLTPNSELLEDSGTTVPSGGVGDSAPSKPASKPRKPPASPKGLDMLQRADFERFKEIYPRREAWVDAEKAWGQMSPDIEKVLAALFWQIPLWSDRDTKMKPLPASYIRGKRWEDEAPAPGSRVTDRQRERGVVDYDTPYDPADRARIFDMPIIRGRAPKPEGEVQA